jgi:hypothetical protein
LEARAACASPPAGPRKETIWSRVSPVAPAARSERTACKDVGDKAMFVAAPARSLFSWWWPPRWRTSCMENAARSRAAAATSMSRGPCLDPKPESLRLRAAAGLQCSYIMLRDKMRPAGHPAQDAGFAFGYDTRHAHRMNAGWVCLPATTIGGWVAWIPKVLTFPGFKLRGDSSDPTMPARSARTRASCRARAALIFQLEKLVFSVTVLPARPTMQAPQWHLRRR